MQHGGQREDLNDNKALFQIFFFSNTNQVKGLTASIRNMASLAHEMPMKAPYLRAASDQSVERYSDAVQEPLFPQGGFQPQHRVPHSHFQSLHLGNTKVFNHNHPFFLLVTKPFLRWLGTAVFIASILATLVTFERKGNFSSSNKTLFNFIITALILGLGLNLFVSNPTAPSVACCNLSIEADSVTGRVQRIIPTCQMEALGD